MNFRGDSVERQRPASDNLVDLHVSVVPMEHWVEKLNYASHQIIGETFSAGFIRVFPDTLISSIREQIKNQLGADILPNEYVFLKHVGRCLALVRQKQETELKVKNFLPPHSIMPEIFVLPGKPTMYMYSVLPPIKSNNTISGDIINKSEFEQSINSSSASYHNTPQLVQENVVINEKKSSIPLPKSAHRSPAKSQVSNLNRKTDTKRQKRHVSGKSSYENEAVINSKEMMTNMARGPTSPGQVSDKFGVLSTKDQTMIVARQSQQQHHDQSPSLAKSTLHDYPKKRRVRYNMPDNNQSRSSSQEFDDYNMYDNHKAANGYQSDTRFGRVNPNHEQFKKNPWKDDDNPQNSQDNHMTPQTYQSPDPQNEDYLDNVNPLNDPKFGHKYNVPADLQNFDLKDRANFHPLGDSKSSSAGPEFVNHNYPKGNFPAVKHVNTNEDSGYMENSDSDEFTNLGYDRIDQRTKISREKNSNINQQKNKMVWKTNTELNKQNDLFQPNKSYDQDNYHNNEDFSEQSNNRIQNNDLLSYHNSINLERQINPPLEIFDRNQNITFNQQIGPLLSKNDSELTEINETGSKVSYRLSQQGYYFNNHEDTSQNKYENHESYEFQENSQFYDDDGIETDESNYESECNDDFQNELKISMQNQSQSHDFVSDHNNNEVNELHDEVVNQNEHKAVQSHDVIRSPTDTYLNLSHKEVNETFLLNSRHAMSNSHEGFHGNENNNDVVTDSLEDNLIAKNVHNSVNLSRAPENMDDDPQHKHISEEIHDSPDHSSSDGVDGIINEPYYDKTDLPIDQSQHEDIHNEDIEQNLSSEKSENEIVESHGNTNSNESPSNTINDNVIMLPQQPLEDIEIKERESISGLSEIKVSTPVMVIGFVTTETTSKNPLEKDISQDEDKVLRGAPDGMPTQRIVNTGGDKKSDKVYPAIDEVLTTSKDQITTVYDITNNKEEKIKTAVKLDDQVKRDNKTSVETKLTTLKDGKTEINKQSSITHPDSNPSPSPIRIPQFNKPAVERHNDTPSPVTPKTPKKIAENKFPKEVRKDTARMPTNNKKEANETSLRSPDRSQLWSNLQRIRSERRASEKERQDLVRQAKVTSSKMNQKRTSVRDMWKKKFFEEKKKATPLEETCKRLQLQLDTSHQRLVSAMEGVGPRVAMQPQKFPSFLPRIRNGPSLKNNSKIQVTRLQHNMDILRRRIEDAKIKLTGEIKLRHQAEEQVKSVRQELLSQKIQCHLAYREVVRGGKGNVFQPSAKSKT